MKKYIKKMLVRFFPSQFQVLELTLLNIQRISNKQQIKILDLGAGPAQYYEKLFLESAPTLISVDLMDAFPFEGKPDTAPNVSIHRVTGVVPDDLTNIQTNSYDLVIAFDLIEHLSRDEGYRLLYEIDRISEHASVIFTPNGFVWQPPTSRNSFDAHLSGWTPAELKSLGWKKIKGHVGAKRFRGPYALPSVNLGIWIIKKIDFIANVYSQFAYKHAFAFTAVKFEKNPRASE
jgi:hypothetical protein